MAVRIEDLTSPVDLSSRLREIRERKGIKQSEIARRMGLDPSIPSLWEQGKRRVPLLRLRSLADALDVSLDELLEGFTPVAGMEPMHAEPVLTPLRGAAATIEPSGPARPATILNAPPEPLPLRPVMLDWARLERPSMRRLLLSRVCDGDRARFDESTDVGEVVNRIASHCATAEDFLNAGLPLLERVFRVVLRNRGRPFSVDDLIDELRESGPTPDEQVLARFGRAQQIYPLRWPD